MSEVKFSLRVPKELYKEALKYSTSNFQSMNSFVLVAITKLVNEHQHNAEVLSGTKSVQVEPGLEALKVKRGKDGKYQKKDGK